MGELRVGPLEDATDLLILGEAAVGVVDDDVEFGFAAGEERYCDGFRACRHLAWDYDASANAGLLCHCLFEIGGMNVHAGAGDDDFALSAEEAKIAGVFLGGEVAGCEPLAFALADGAGLPCRSGEHVAAHEDLAFVADAYLAAGEGFADGAATDAEGMIEGDECGGLGHSVALD